MAGEARFRPWDGPLQRIFRGEVDRAVAEAAARRGLITDAQLAEALAEAETSSTTVTSVLLARACVDAATLAALEEGFAREAFVRTQGRPADEVLPAEVAQASSDPQRHLAEFVLVTPIGQGGTGQVWKAWDRNLSRWVAVKVSGVFLESRAARERFNREALAAAKLSHPNITPVHRIGIDGERVYLVMPFIEGRTLVDLRVPVAQALELVRTVALAVDYAHRQGVIHRDLKPANIMIDDGGQVFVVDFGLAYLLHREQARGLTQPGDLVGTAGFMSPEQARGEEESHLATADVYGLGATLYYLVTGQAPFMGPSLAAIVRKVVEDEPVAPRRLRPDLDRRVEGVVLKALAKDPRERHASAAELAAELELVLRGGEVARPAERRGRRLTAWLRRQRAPLAAVAVVLAAIAVAGKLAVKRIRDERETALTAMRDMARMSLETALALRRAGDVPGMRQTLPKLLHAYRDLQQHAGETAETDYLMGRMYRALMDEDRALLHQERALARAPLYAPSLYERAVLLSKRYGLELDRELSQAPEGVRNVRTITQVESARPDLARLRESILHDGQVLQSRRSGTVDAAAIDGILAYHRRDYGKARATLEKLVARDPLREELWQALALTARAQGRAGEAETFLTEALGHDRGYFPHLVERCHVRLDLWRAAEAVVDASAALAMDADFADAHLCRGLALTSRVERARNLPDDLVRMADAAVADLDRSLARRPGTAIALCSRGIAHRYVGQFVDMRSGRDPLPRFARAEQDMTRAIELDPNDSAYWASRGWLYSARAIYRRQRGEDPSPDCASTEADFWRALALQPGNAGFLQGIADVRALRALYRGEHGDLRGAEEELARTDDLTAQDVAHGFGSWIYNRRGYLHTWRGHFLLLLGADPLAAWDRAQAAFDRALQLDASNAEALAGRALLLVERAGHWKKLGRANRRRADLESAAQDVARVTERYPRFADGWMARGNLQRETGDLRAAQQAYGVALQINPLLRLQIDRYLTGRAP